MSLSQFIVDLNLRKSWLVASRFDPDVVIFLGDMMDNGRLTSSDEECASFFRRFSSFVSLRYGSGTTRTSLDSSLPSSSETRRQKCTTSQAITMWGT